MADHDTIRDALQQMVDAFSPYAWGSIDSKRDALNAATEALASPPVAVQEEGDAKDGARYREFFASGLPITFLGVEYRTKAELDAAIDAVMGDQP